MNQETYSFSRLTAYDTCPQMYDYTYIHRKPKLKGVFSEYGTLTHSVLERYEKGELDLAVLPDVFEWEWDSTFEGLKWPPNKYVDLEESYKKQGLAFFRGFQGLPEDAEILGVEQHFEFPIGDFNLQGYIDLAYRRNEKLVILDWKTAKAYGKNEITYKQRQPYLYSMWVKSEFGSFPDEIRFYHTRDNKNVRIPFKEDVYEEAIRWAVNQVNTIRQTWDFPPNPSEFFCMNICSVRGSCECGCSSYWKEQRKTK